ncbi:MAG TPA: hypothetical protein VF800_17945 [Telluria sp.]|jgi:hypothetical protein
MSNRALVSIPLLLAMLSGCSTYVPPAGKPMATLTMYMENDTPGTRMRNGSAIVYNGAECERSASGTIISRNLSMDDKDELPSKPIAADQEFSFAMNATHVLWGGNSGCSVTATFTPKANDTYDARLYIRGNSASCELVIVDQDNHAVPFTKPAYSCVQTLDGITRNGAGWYKSIDWLILPLLTK